eukprot:TRINITY_DN12314_c0_g1_i12.p2 TRINITY_DN12314_c0_g1~~TRINITY_DN12314_c0_g1_i12.p2  ORF type:complete len:134 (-),score=33.48 TRINITY_DN12314_c0_g1_i12:174-575(-)
MGVPVRLQMEILKRLNVDEGEKKVEKKEKEPEAKEEVNEWKRMVEEICREVPTGRAEVLKIMQTILKNLIEYPTERKYRIIKLDNKKIQSTIGISNTAIEFLAKVELTIIHSLDSSVWAKCLRCSTTNTTTIP